MNRVWDSLHFDVTIPVTLERTTGNKYVVFSHLFGSDLRAEDDTPEGAIQSYYVALRAAFEERAETEQSLGRAFLQAYFDADNDAQAAVGYETNPRLPKIEVS